jgi:amidophosphoribosyltransferase
VALNLPYREGFIKNRYIARTFIMPGQKLRQKTIKQKLNPIKSEFMGKRVILVDDSIVRGTTRRGPYYHSSSPQSCSYGESL